MLHNEREEGETHDRESRRGESSSASERGVGYASTACDAGVDGPGVGSAVTAAARSRRCATASWRCRSTTVALYCATSARRAATCFNSLSNFPQDLMYSHMYYRTRQRCWVRVSREEDGWHTSSRVFRLLGGNTARQCRAAIVYTSRNETALLWLSKLCSAYLR